MKKFPFFATFLCFFLACVSATQAKQTFTITSNNAEFNQVDIGNKGLSIGDVFQFESTFTTKDGKMGRFYGIASTISIPTSKDDPFIDRMTWCIFDFGKGDTILFSGLNVYGTYEGEMFDNTPRLRAITGGTGKFIGARGQISTTRTPSGVYEFELQLLD